MELCPRAGSTSIGLALNRAIVWSLMPFCSGASTSLMIGVIQPVERRARLLDRHARLQPREQIRPVAPPVVEALPAGCHQRRAS